MSKRIISLLLSVALFFSCCPLVAQAAEDTECALEVSDVYAVPGSTVEVDIEIKNNPGILGATLTVSWDEGLTLVGCANGEAFANLSMTEPSRLVSGCNFVWYGSKTGEVKDGTILTLTYKVPADAADAEVFDIRVTYDPADILDARYNPVQLDITNGSVRIVTYTPGDVSGDDRVNPLDLIMLSQYISDGGKTDPDGYNVTINESAADVNDDNKLNPLDLILISQFISDDCKTDPEGYNVELKPHTPRCQHTMEYTSENPATCTDKGNHAYWRCTSCGKYFDDANGAHEISQEDTVIEAPGHTEEVIPATDSHGEGLRCSVCGLTLKEPEPLEKDEYHISYKLPSNDSYLAGLNIENPNPDTYTSEDGVEELLDLDVPGYDFYGWYTEREGGGTRVSKISAGTTGNMTLYAHMTPHVYEVNYKLYQTPIKDTIKEEYKSYTVDKGLVDLPNPELYNYIFLGWYLDDGTEVTSIPVGTTEDITLNAYWTSKRNQAKSVEKLEDPIIIENIDEGVIYFAYEIGTIENVPLTETPIWRIDSVAGLTQQISETITTEISATYAQEIAKIISETTVDSATWTLSKDWNDVIEVSESWAKEHGMSQEEALEQMTTSSGTISVTDSKGGSDTTTTTDGTTTVTYDSQNDESEFGAELNAKIGASYSNEKAITKKLTGSYSLSAEIGGKFEQNDKVNKHTGTDTTAVDTTVTANNSSWNKASTESKTETESTNQSVSKALSEIISNTKGYGKSYSSGGENSQAYDTSSSKSESVNSSSTLTYFNSKTVTKTSTYTTDGMTEGSYRLVVAGTVHVFAVVGYDVATKSYFTYTFNVLDDKTKEFLDYSPDGSFEDCENGALPFEIPYFVYEYVNAATVKTDGLNFTTNTADRTATVASYTGESADVTIPSYFISGNTAYKVTGLTASAFAGQPIRAIVLSDFIDVIPDGAFKGCSELEQIAGCFTKIGAEAFSGCTSLEQFAVSPRTTYIGKDAFYNVPQLKMTALSKEYALEHAKRVYPDGTDKVLNEFAVLTTESVISSVVKSGAKNIIVDLTNIIEGTTLNIVIPEGSKELNIPQVESFELKGKKGATYSGMTIDSAAEVTTLRELAIDGDGNGVPLKIASQKLVLDVVTVNSSGFALVLAEDGAVLSLVRDNVLNSESRMAVVCKNAVIKSEVVDNAVGTLSVTGNGYYCGSVSASLYVEMSEGEWIEITDDEFEGYKKGLITITFDANGGEVTPESITAYFGQPVGALPVPTRAGHSFAGWFTEDGREITAGSSLYETGNVTLYARWTVLDYTASWDTGTGYTITVNRTASPYASAPLGELSSGATIYHGDVLSITYTASTGYTINSMGSTSITVTGNVTSSSIYCTAAVNQYTASWSEGTGYTITVTRTSSLLKGAPVETLNSGAVVYFGDELNVTYTANEGYTIKSFGSTSITVNSDVTAAMIYAVAELNSYTYNIIYKSSNGTDLGTATVTNKYGTTNTITAPAKSGYDTPEAQSVVWDSTSAKTITFIYEPSAVATYQEIARGTWWYYDGAPRITYCTGIEYRNRTADSVEVRVRWENTLVKYYHYGYKQCFDATVAGIGTGAIQIVPASLWTRSTSNDRSHAETSMWLTIPLNTTDQVTLSVSGKWYDNNEYPKSGTWSGNFVIPAY